MQKRISRNLSKILNILNLSESDLEILLNLMRHMSETGDGATITELAGKIGKSRSTVQKCLQKLWERGLVDRRIALSRNGGHVCVFYPRPAQEIVRKIVEHVEQALKDAVMELEMLLREVP